MHGRHPSGLDNTISEEQSAPTLVQSATKRMRERNHASLTGRRFRYKMIIKNTSKRISARESLIIIYYDPDARKSNDDSLG
jgi:hypothetical protein